MFPFGLEWTITKSSYFELTTRQSRSLITPNKKTNLIVMPPSTPTLFESQPCICCGRTNQDIVYPIDIKYAANMSGFNIPERSLGVTECRHCTHSYIQPMPQPAFLTAFYESYMSKAKKGFYKERANTKEIPKKFKERYTPWLVQLKELNENLRSILDIGTGLGMFLRLAQKHGFEVTGVEPNSEAASALRNSYNIPVINQLFENSTIEQHFDVLTMWDLLEHLAAPQKALKKAYDVLNPNGILVLEVPAKDSLIHDLAKFLYRFSGRKICRPLYLICGVHHLHYFSEKTICDLLQTNGFKIVEMVRGETDLKSLYRGQPNNRKFKAIIYNLSLNLIFGCARFIGRQNKLIILAQKQIV